MLKPPWGINAPLTRPSDQDSGTDLQADVMRFMAILAFCLLAVFALVQSVPMGVQDHSMTQARSVAPVKQEVKPPALNSTKETKQSAQEKPIQGKQDTKKPRQAQLQSTDAKPTENKETDAPKPSRSVQVKNQTSSDRLEARPRHQRVPEHATSSADARAPTTTSSQHPTRRSVHSARDAKGFALRFESDFALESLVAKGKVHLFGQVGKRIWQLSIKGGHLRFYPTTSPRQFHTMTPESVPAHITTALRRDAAVAQLERITWGVTLPRATTDQVMRHLRDSSGGSLLIQPDGQVRLHDAS